MTARFVSAKSSTIAIFCLTLFLHIYWIVFALCCLLKFSITRCLYSKKARLKGLKQTLISSLINDHLSFVALFLELLVSNIFN